jgi:hypothetical protein
MMQLSRGHHKTCPWPLHLPARGQLQNKVPQHHIQLQGPGTPGWYCTTSLLQLVSN